MKDGRISLLSTDYDGTLSPLDVKVEESSPSSSLDAILRAIATKAKLAVVTSKSFEFISTRIPYANSWGCVSGLDLRFDDGTEFAVSPTVDVEAELSKAKAMLGDGVAYEEKRSSASLLGFSVDWRGRSAPPEVAHAVDELEKDGLYVARDPLNPFVDFFCSVPDKGTAVQRIKKEFGLSRGTLFMGDSPSDNPAFREVDVAIGVDHGQPLGALECGYVVSQDDVTRFLKSLYDRDMMFHPGLAGLLRRGA